MELTVRDLLNAVTTKPWDETEKFIEIHHESGTYVITSDKAHAIEHYGDNLVTACEISFHNIDIWVKED